MIPVASDSQADTVSPLPQPSPIPSSAAWLPFPWDGVAGGEDVRTVSPSALAYVGDAVYELLVRRQLLFPLRRPKDYHGAVVERVRAEAQARNLEALLPLLTETERDVVKRGRNAPWKHPKRLDPMTYQLATGFEALVGYLYLTAPERLLFLLEQIGMGAVALNSSSSDRDLHAP